MTITAPEKVGESLDPRDPLLRLATFFDDGTVELLHERDKSGVLAAGGTINGVRTIAFATDGTVMGGAMGVDGCKHIVDAYDTAIEEQSPIIGIWHSGGARLAEGVKAGEFRDIDPVMFYTSLVGACDHLFFGRHAMSRATGVGPVTDEVCRQYIKHMEALICGGLLKANEKSSAAAG